MVDLLAFLYGLPIAGVGDDVLVWGWLGSKDIFSASSFYRGLCGVMEGEFPWRRIWVTGVPSKVAFFVWTAAFDSILTIDNLVCWRHVLVNWCCMCCVTLESVDHLLAQCPVASCLWALIFSTFAVQWVQPEGVLGVLWSWARGWVGKRRRKAWNLALLSLMWLIWLERNRRIFQEVVRSVYWLELRFLHVLCGWVSVQVDPDLFTFLGFLDDMIGGFV